MDAVTEGVSELEEEDVRVTVTVREAVDVSPILAEMVIEEERVGAAEVEGSAEGVKPSVAVTEGDELVLGVGRGTGALGDVDSVADAEVLDVGPVEADSLAGGPAIIGVCPGGAPGGDPALEGGAILWVGSEEADSLSVCEEERDWLGVLEEGATLCVGSGEADSLRVRDVVADSVGVCGVSVGVFD